MLLDRVSNPGPLTNESGALPIALLLDIRECFEISVSRYRELAVYSYTSMAWAFCLKQERKF